ncbi:hypothetical protein Pcinc_012906 [Petrolisthes cinctipes]|uniref:Uncharacterized protein n=1 Tax=Petrolisthes cinctipes TaxID=88211 RepID=A0AAE1EQV1_PETCI|nr:hypothetical protein Pcinc_034126 [Petrolisthes cinctipes]KAK3882738.1 hypothetical protein Pcinc_012906 [Petrolisthes cinctipes]
MLARSASSDSILAQQAVSLVRHRHVGRHQVMDGFLSISRRPHWIYGIFSITTRNPVHASSRLLIVRSPWMDRDSDRPRSINNTPSASRKS